MSLELQEAVDFYQKLGFCIIPARYREKIPLVEWKEYQYRKPTEDEIKTWFSGRQEVNVAIVCGRASGNLVVLDFDSEEAYHNFFPKHEQLEHSTLVVRTGRGVHVYFRTEKPVPSQKFPEIGLEVHSDGTIVIAPPSLHPTGKRYEFIDPNAPLGQIKADELDKAIRDFLSRKGIRDEWREWQVRHARKTYRGENPPCIRKLLEGVEEGFRNEAAIRLASYFTNLKGFSPEDTFEALRAWNERNRPPLPERELQEVVQSVSRHGYAYGCRSLQQFCDPRNCPLKPTELLEAKLQEEEELAAIKNLPPEELEAITSELTPDELKKKLGLTIKRDDTNKLIHFLAGVLTYTEEDQVNISNRGPSATGKSYLPIEIATLYFPKSDIQFIAYASPTAFFHDLGEWDDELKGYRINLERKILIFLDQPHDELLHRLRPLLSHDQKELVVKITDKREKKGLRTKTVVIRGFPTVYFCTGSLKMDEQEATRSFVLSPETTLEKIREAIYLKAYRKGNPLDYAKMVEENTDRERLAKRILLIKHSGVKNIIIENPNEVAERFMQEFPKLKPRHTRDIERVISLAKAFALLNLWHRRREGDTLYVDPKDIENAFELYKQISEAQELGIAPYLLRVYKEVLVPLYCEKNALQKEGEPPLGLTRQEISKKYFDVYGVPLPDWKLKQELLPALESAGLVSQEVDPCDRRRRLIYVITPPFNSTFPEAKVVDNSSKTPSLPPLTSTFCVVNAQAASNQGLSNSRKVEMEGGGRIKIFWKVVRQLAPTDQHLVDKRMLKEVLSQYGISPEQVDKIIEEDASRGYLIDRGGSIQPIYSRMVGRWR